MFCLVGGADSKQSNIHSQIVIQILVDIQIADIVGRLFPTFFGVLFLSKNHTAEHSVLSFVFIRHFRSYHHSSGFFINMFDERHTVGEIVVAKPSRHVATGALVPNPPILGEIPCDRVFVGTLNAVIPRLPGFVPQVWQNCLLENTLVCIIILENVPQKSRHPFQFAENIYNVHCHCHGSHVCYL